RGAIRVDHARWITMRPVAPIAPIASVRPAIVCARGSSHPRGGGLDPAGVRANGTRQIAARTVDWKWAFAGHRGSGYLAPSEMHARLKALLERMEKALNAGSGLLS